MLVAMGSKRRVLRGMLLPDLKLKHDSYCPLLTCAGKKTSQESKTSVLVRHNVGLGLLAVEMMESGQIIDVALMGYVHELI